MKELNATSPKYFPVCCTFSPCNVTEQNWELAIWVTQIWVKPDFDKFLTEERSQLLPLYRVQHGGIWLIEAHLRVSFKIVTVSLFSLRGIIAGYGYKLKTTLNRLYFSNKCDSLSAALKQNLEIFFLVRNVIFIFSLQ